MTCVADGAARALRNRPLLAAYGRTLIRQGACTGPVAEDVRRGASR